MALSLGVKKGTRISIADHDLVVKQIEPTNRITVSLDGGPDLLVTEQERTEILPAVFVFSGVGATGNGNRLAFVAPRSISITRHDVDQPPD